MTSTMAGKPGQNKGIRGLLILAFWVGIWYLGAYLVECRVQGRGNELLLPYPGTVARCLASLARTKEFWLSILRTFLRILAGLAAGTLIGGALSVATCRYSLLDSLLSPAIRVIRATPVTSFILLILLWTGRDHVPGIIAALMVLPVIWENLCQGIRSTDPKLLEMGKMYRFSKIKMVYLIYFPTIRPYFAAAITTAMGLAWKSGVAAEVLCLPKFAIGTHIYQSKLYLEVGDLFAWTLVVVGISIALEKLLRWALLTKGRRKIG